MNKRRMRMAKYQKTADLEVIGKIQDLYIQNLVAYSDKIKSAHKKAVIKRCYKIVNLLKSIEDEGDDFVSDWVNKETVQLEDSMFKSTWKFGTLYEQVQVAIHSSLRDMGFGYCLLHKINIHYCKECKKNFGVDEEGDS